MRDHPLRGGLRAGRLILVLSVLGAGELIPLAAAQTGPLPWRIDCGDSNGPAPLEPGWQLLGETASLPLISMAPAPLDTVHVAQTAPMGGVLFGSDVYSVDPDELDESHRLTALQLADNTVITITGLQASKPYRVRLELGALSAWVDVTTAGVEFKGSTVSRDVRVEEKTPGTSNWRTLVRDVRCATGTAGNSYTSSVGSIVPVWCLVHSDSSGVLRLRFSTDGSDPLFLSGFELHAWEQLPVWYQHSAAGALKSSSPVLAGFVAAFNADDHVGAQQVALGLADPWLRGVALCHVIGWLDGTRDGAFNLIDTARASLLSAQASHPGAPWLLDQLDQLQRALDHLAARGYAWARECPSQGGFGFLNTDCAGQLVSAFGAAETNVNAHIALRLLQGLCAPATGATVLADIKAWNAGPGGNAGWEPNPFVFGALKLYGTTQIAMNPTLGVNAADPESAEFLQRFRDIFQYGFLDPAYDVGDFPKDIELKLLKRVAELGKHPYMWDSTQIASALTDADIAASWWGPQVVAMPDAAGAPPWANRQREVQSALRNLAEFWLSERLQRGEMGGGLGDDVELVTQLAPLLAGQQDQSVRRILDGLDSITRHTFDEAGVMTDGYFSGGMTDSEHAAEYSTDLGIATRAAFGPTRRLLVNGLQVGRKLVNAAQPSDAWAASTVLGRLHFKSYFFTADGPDDDPDHAQDHLMNGRALVPAVGAGLRGSLASGHPLLVDLRRAADGWRDDALSSSGKPVGFIGPVDWPSNTFGNAGLWWSTTGSPGETQSLSKSQISYQLELLRMAYRTSTATDRWRYLLPAVRILRAVQQWEDKGGPAGTQGSQDWAAELVRDGPRFHAIVISLLQDLASEPKLTTVDDPSLAGSAPYVDSVLLERLHEWGEKAQGLGGANLAMAYALQPVEPCGPGSTAKGPALPIYAYDQAWPYLRMAWPLLTRHVLHTDRVFVNHGLVCTNLVSAHTGGNLAEGFPQRPLLRWMGRTNEAPLDLAVSVNGRAWDESWISAFVYNFAPSASSLDLWLDEGLDPGKYRIEIGAPSPKCDMFAVGAPVTTTFCDKRGAGASAEIILPPGYSLVRVTRDGAPSAPAKTWDLALDPPEIELQKSGGSTTLVFRARVANLGASASPAGTLTFHAALLTPNGSPLPLLPDEALIGTFTVPALAACTGWTADEHVVEMELPMTQLISTVLLYGIGIQVRADVSAGPDEWDLLNDSYTRMALPGEIPFGP